MHRKPTSQFPSQAECVTTTIHPSCHLPWCTQTIVPSPEAHRGHELPLSCSHVAIPRETELSLLHGLWAPLIFGLLSLRLYSLHTPALATLLVDLSR